jgi:hypothetical protein
MKQENRIWTLSSIVLAAAGVAVMGIGFYFIFLRPPLLPEDLRYMALSAAQLDVVRPRLAHDGRKRVTRVVITVTCCQDRELAHEQLSRLP